MQTEQRRKFSRISFHGDARLLVGDKDAACAVCDLSMKGALLEIAVPLALSVGERCLLELHLADGNEVVVRMEGDAVHRENNHVGIVWKEIDLDSMTHLRRLLEFNLGDPDLLNREFSALIAN